MRALLIAGVFFAGLTLIETASACEPCADQARQYRKCAQEARAAAVKTASWATQANTYKQQAQLCDQAAQNLEAMYSQCKAGTPNKCGGGGGGGSGGARSGGGQASAGGGQPSLMDQTNNVFQSMRGQSESEVRNGLSALRALNEELARAAQRGGGNANQAARAIGNASLEDVDRDDAPIGDPAGIYHTDPRPKPPPAPPPAPEPVVPNPGPAVTEVDFTTKEMNTLVPVGDPPPAPPERLAEDMLTTAVAPPSAMPREVLGIPVGPQPAAPGGGTSGSSTDRDGPNGLHLSDEFWKTASGDLHKGQINAVNEWKAEALVGFDEAKQEAKELFDPFVQAHTAATRDDGEGALAGGKVIAKGASSEGAREDIRNAAGVGGGAIDRSVRALNGGGEEEATAVEREYLSKPESDYGISLLRHYLPRPAQKMLDMSERASAKFDDAAATAVDIVHHVKVYYGAAKETKRFVRAQARDAAEVVVDSVQSFFGGAPQ